MFGLGAIGQLLVQLSVAMRVAPLVATDPLPHRCQQALLSGGSAVVVSQRDEPAPAEFGLDVAFEVAGTDSAVAAALATVRPGGRVVLIGIPAGDRTSFEASLARRRGLTMLACRRMRADDLRRAAHLMDQGLVQPAPLVTHRFALSDVLAAFTAHADYRGIKVVVDPGKA